MKRIITITIIILLAFVLGGCSADSVPKGTAEKKDKIIDVGEFEVMVPKGWWAYPQEDVNQDTDAEGNTQFLKDSFAMIKDGTCERDILKKPWVYIYYHDDVDAGSRYAAAKSEYDEVRKFTVTIDETECNAFESKDVDCIIAQHVFVPVSETSCFEFVIAKTIDVWDGVTVNDEDVMKIIESAKVK